MPKIDIVTVPERKGTGYPPQFNAPCADRIRQRLGNAGGLTDFGVNLMRLPPGNWSSQRHWHSHEDEFVYVLEGELILVEDEGETVLPDEPEPYYRVAVRCGFVTPEEFREVLAKWRIAIREVYSKVFPKAD